MLFFVQVHRAPRLRSAVAVAVCVAASVPASAQDGAQVSALPTVVVTASRSPQPLQHVPVGASVITSDMLVTSGVVDINEAIRKLAGVPFRSDLSNGREYTLDLRGFGQTANQNLVVLVDGIRLSENELLSARLSAIPLSQVERIEIVRGGNSVMWGEGASAGVINVVLKERVGVASAGQVSVAVESFSGRELQANGVHGWGNHALELAAKQVETGGYRDNSDYKQSVGGVGYQWADAGWLLKWRTQSEEQKARLPGSLTFNQFSQNPRQTLTPKDFGNSREVLHSVHLAKEIGAWKVGIDGASKVRDSSSFYDDAWGGYAIDNRRISRQWSPYLLQSANWGGAKGLTTLGFQTQNWSFDEVNTYGQEQGHQYNRARYIKTEWQLPTQTQLSLGWRNERVRKASSRGYDRHDRLFAREWGVNQSLQGGLDVYGRVAQSYRLANIDENRFTPSGLPLLPQINRDREVGIKWGKGAHAATWRWFTQQTRNEIAYDASLSSNVNIAPARRRGMELEGRWQVTRHVEVSGTWQALRARYTEGPDAGRDMVLVAPHTATLRVNVQLNQGQSVEVGVQRMSAMRFDNDKSNTCSDRIPASALMDARYAVNWQSWDVAFSVNNLTDRDTYNMAFSCTTGALYPESGRAFRLSVTRRF